VEHGVSRFHGLIAIFKAKSSSVAVCRHEQEDRRSGRDVDAVDTVYKIWMSSTENSGSCIAGKHGSSSCRRRRGAEGPDGSSARATVRMGPPQE